MATDWTCGMPLCRVSSRLLITTISLLFRIMLTIPYIPVRVCVCISECYWMLVSSEDRLFVEMAVRLDAISDTPLRLLFHAQYQVPSLLIVKSSEIIEVSNFTS
jgi:hypothetical protein